MPRGLSVSLVIPVYNEQDMIGPCLDAVLAQTVPAGEVIVVDNNSTDATRERLAAYAARVTVIGEPRQGVHHARTTGMDAASGDIIARIDADTRLPPGWIARVRDVFADPAVAGVTGPARYYDIALSPLVTRADLLIRNAWSRPRSDGLDWIFGANMAVRAAAWRAVRGTLCTGPDIHEDQDLGIHLYAAGERVVFVPGLVVGMSSRRVRDDHRDFRAYLRMTETGYRSHAALARRHSYGRAWMLTRILLFLHRPLRRLHAVRAGRHPPARKHPMSEGLAETTGPGERCGTRRA